MAGVLTSPVTQAPLPKLLPRDNALWGPLEKLEPIGGGLLHVKVGDLEHLLPEELESKLQPLLNQGVVIVRAGDEYGVGALA